MSTLKNKNSEIASKLHNELQRNVIFNVKF